MKTKTLLLILSIYCAMNAQAQQYCQTDRFLGTPYFDTSQIKVNFDILYDVPNLLTLDLYYPKLNADPLSKRPVIVLIPGGFYLAGSSKDWYYYAYQLAQSGYVVAAINTRKGLFYPCKPTKKFPIPFFSYSDAAYRAVQDAIKAGHFLSTESLLYGIDANNMFFGGYSTGGCTALSVEMLSQSEANHVLNLNTVVLGPLDPLPFLFPFSVKGINSISGGISRAHIEKIENTSAIMFHGELDYIIFYDFSPILDGICGPQAKTLLPVYGSGKVNDFFHDKAKAMQLYGLLFATHYFEPDKDFAKMTSKFACFDKQILCKDFKSFKKENLLSIPVKCSLNNRPETSEEDERTSNIIKDEFKKIEATIPEEYRDQITLNSLVTSDKAGLDSLKALMKENQGNEIMPTQENESATKAIIAGKNTLQLSLSADISHPINISFYNLNGTEIMGKTVMLHRGENSITMQFPQTLQQGIYILKTSDGLTQKVFIQ